MATIDNTTAASDSLGPLGSHNLARASDGRLWAVWVDSSDDVQVAYSDNDGTSWSTVAGLELVGTYVGCALSVDLDDNLWLAAQSTNAIVTYVAKGGATGTAPSGWTDDLNTASVSSGGGLLDMVTFDSAAFGGGATVAAVLQRTSSDRLRLSIVGFNGTATLISYQSNILSSETCDTDVGAIDFHHTGDGRTTKSGAPHLFYSWVDNGRLKFARARHDSGNNWSRGTVRTLSSSAEDFTSLAFDGTRVVIAGVASSATDEVAWFERDAGDTTTTTRTTAALSDGAITALSSATDGQDVFVAAIGTTSDDPSILRYDRAGASFEAWETWATVTATALSLARTAYGGSIDGVYVTTGPAVVHAQADSVNDPPNAPTWVTASGVADVDETLELDWDFSDPQAGDSQSAYALSRQIGAGTIQYWRASDSSWQASEQKNTSGTSSVTLPASWGSGSDQDHTYKVKTWDQSDEAGPYGSGLTVDPSAQVNPSITSPGDGATVTDAQVTVEWTVASTSTQYLARLLDADGAVVETSGWVTSSATSHEFGSTLVDGETYDVEVTTRNGDGLTSDADTHTFTADFVEPATPTVTLGEIDGLGLITVTVTHPAPSGGQPTVTSQDVWRRVTAEGGDGIRLAAALDETDVYSDYTVASGVDYEYRVKAMADDGTSSWSVWTGA